MNPSLRIVSTHKGHFPLCFIDGVLYSRRSARIYKWENLEESPVVEDVLPIPFILRILGSMRLPQRVLRLGVSHLAVSPDHGALAVVNKRVLWKSPTTHVWKEIGSFSHISRPMRFGVCRTSDGSFLMGEYLSNPLRRKVQLWRVHADGKMYAAQTFLDHTIRHIHAVQEDPFTKHIWIATGDYGPECSVFSSTDGCRTLSLVGQGDQSWRTCCFLFRENVILWGMDSPSERSYIVRLDRLSGKREFLAELPGPIWHGTSNEQGWDSFSTTVEPSNILREPKAHLWSSPNGRDFFPIASFDKDSLHWHYFQFGMIYFPTGIAPENYLVFSGNALREYENTLVIGRLYN